MKHAAVLITSWLAVWLLLGCADAPSHMIAPGGAQSDPVSTAALLPPSVRISLPVDSVLAGDTLGSVTAMAFDYSGKAQHQASIAWSVQSVDSAPGFVLVLPVNAKAQQVTLRGVTRGRVRLIASYSDRYGQTARDSAAFRVAPRTATVGICLLDPHVADSLGIKGDTTVDWGIVGQFCIQNDTIWIRQPSDTSGADTTKAAPNRISMGGGFGVLLEAKVQVRVHILRPKGARQ